MKDTLILKRVAVRVIPFLIGIYLGRNITQTFQDLSGVNGGMSSQFAPIAIFASILGMGIVVWASFKEFKIPMALSFVLMCCGVAIAAFGLWMIL